MTAFALDPRLEADTHFVTDFTLSRVCLMDDARFPWAVLVPRVPGASEWFDLDAAGQALLAREALGVAAQMKRVFAAQKMNVAALGNMVAQLHVHVVARFEGDAAWPGPVWGAGQRMAYAHAAREERLALLRALTPP